MISISKKSLVSVNSKNVMKYLSYNRSYSSLITISTKTSSFSFLSLYPLINKSVISNARYNSTSTPSTIKYGKPLRIDRELPDPTKEQRKLMASFILFGGIMVTALAVIFNYEKTENAIVTNTLYQLRRSEKIRDLIGENIEFDGLIPWVYGQLNPMAGKVNIRFYIKGNKNKSGEIKLVADRSNKDQEFLIHEWSLTVDEQQFDLLEENSSFL